MSDHYTNYIKWIYKIDTELEFEPIIGILGNTIGIIRNIIGIIPCCIGFLRPRNLDSAKIVTALCDLAEIDSLNQYLATNMRPRRVRFSNSILYPEKYNRLSKHTRYRCN